jgi:hypothetical protein
MTSTLKLKRTDHGDVGGNKSVVAHPAFRRVPECLFPLVTDKAKSEYNAIARMLFNAGRLSMASHRTLCSYAMQFDTIIRNTEAGKPIRAHSFTQMDRARAQLKLDDLDSPIAAPEDAPTNKFAAAGFSARRRQAVRQHRV